MTTTESPRAVSRHSATALGAAVAVGALSGVVVSLQGWWISGTPALVGGLLGTAVTVVVLATGFMVVDLVAGLMPAASLMVAVLTYTLQLVLLGLLLAALRGAEDVEQTLSPGWFASGVIAVALTWTVCQVVQAMRARIPLYDLAEGSDR